MWIQGDGTFGMVARLDPESLLDLELRDRIDRLSDREKVELIDALEAYEDALGEELQGRRDELANAVVNEPFRHLDIPDEYILRNDRSEDDLYTVLREQVAQTTPRWQLEQIYAPIAYLYDSGPGPRKMKRIRKDTGADKGFVRVFGTERVALGVAGATWGLAGVVAALVGPLHDDAANRLGQIFFGAAAAYFVGRAMFMGFYTSASSLKIVSWFRTYVIAREDVRRIDHEAYDGVATRGAEFGLVRVAVIYLRSGTSRAFRGVPLSRRRARRAAQEITAWSSQISTTG